MVFFAKKTLHIADRYCQISKFVLISVVLLSPQKKSLGISTDCRRRVYLIMCHSQSTALMSCHST